ncbi:hypothetical protein VISI1226_07363 [Vibrio sinaloensis DSM 21326]|uniref:Uncharacterized protein n=1 Tax=Vibrio sinaloensis DSM 21326 TaxID=945550 RepID=E8MAF7_PHOS4|nr:hypothetical protein VISI1226_07363 [Vibrio sinaloensis DSM 21326]
MLFSLSHGLLAVFEALAWSWCFIAPEPQWLDAIATLCD